ncbi:hypothetical protein HEN05_012570 [Escherichia coli]|uniref:hypothetical protein n=1 Tax=Escherichia coli TaxID=562 RepID=UPI000B7C6CD5|nr:hypothetical protein [Escherichia coli]EFI6483315.1 hypothetical protein [Escherichia coli]MBB2323500.1 hypothetical protein [Escherichia coli]MCY9856475.1 hypothetical protein [Escherichia coli]
MPEIKKSKDYNAGFADVFITTGMNVGDNAYCHITFCRHVVDNLNIPDETNTEAGVNMFLEATSSVTLPMSMAKNMAQAILNATVMDPGLIEPFERELKKQD